MSKQNALMDFEWENDNNMFGIGGDTTPPTPAGKTDPEEDDDDDDQDDEPGKAKPKTALGDIEEDDDDLFSPKDEEEEEVEEEEEEVDDKANPEKTKKSKVPAKKEEEVETNIYQDLYEDLKEHGIMTVELEEFLEEGGELDADTFFELNEMNVERKVDEKITSLFATMDEDAKEFLKFKRNGGKTEDFFKTFTATAELGEGNLEDEKYQDRLITFQLQQEGWDKDEIEDRLEYLAENGKKKKLAEKYEAKIKQDREKAKQTLVETQEKQAKLAAKQKAEFKAELEETLKSVNDVKGFKLTPETKKELVNFLTIEKYPTSSKRNISGFQKALAEALNDKDKLLLMAELLRTDFDMSSYKKAVKTEKVREVKSKLEQRSSMRPKGSGSSHTSGKSLADLF